MIALDDLKKLPLEEKMRIVDELTKSIEEDWDAFETPELFAELEARHARYLENPSSALPWEEVLERIRSRHQPETSREGDSGRFEVKAGA